MTEWKEGCWDVAEPSLGVREGAARAVLRDAWNHGHETVELRQDGKRVIFFCTLCSTRCYSDGALSDHLNGNLHARRYAAAKMSILASPAWPFNDGVVFSFPSSKQEGMRAFSPPAPIPNNNSSNNQKNYTDEVQCRERSPVKESKSSNPGPSCKVGTSSFPLEWIGCGHVFMRVLQFGTGNPAVKAVWCCWLGEKRGRDLESQDSNTSLAECEYAIVSFPYTHTLGRGGSYGNSWRASGSPMDIDRSSRRRKKKGRPPKVNSHPLFEVASGEAANDASRNLDTQVGEKSFGELAMDVQGKNLSNRALKRALRRQRVKALERLCFICHQQMLPGKDVAALFNRKSGFIACSSRNKRGVKFSDSRWSYLVPSVAFVFSLVQAFHVFHTSCLIDWVLLCESKIWVSHLNGSKGTRKSRWSVFDQRNRICGVKQINGSKGTSSNCASIFCPECQGTGLKTRGGQLEVPRYRLAQVSIEEDSHRTHKASLF